MTGQPGAAEPRLDADAAWDRLLRIRDVDSAAAAGLHVDDAERWTWRTDATPEATQLAELYAPLVLAGDHHVFAQLGQSLDGFIATRTGDAVFVTGEEDRRHLHRLRALADAVVVGASTAIADDPRLTVRAAAGSNPVRVLLDPHRRVPIDRQLLTDGVAPTLWIVSAAVPESAPAAPHVEVVRLPTGADGRFDRQQVLDLLARRGLGRVLVEGGGATVSAFLRGDQLRRLYLTVAPVLIGDGVPGIRFDGTDVMREALRPPARTFRLGDDVVFDLDLSPPAEGERAQP